MSKVTIPPIPILTSNQTKGAIPQPPTNESFKSFSQNIELKRQNVIQEKRIQHHQQIDPTHNHEVVTELVELKEVEEEDSDGRSLLDRFMEPTSESNAILASFLTRALTSNHGELILQLGLHNLPHKSLSSLLDSPSHSKPTPDDTTTTTTTKEGEESIPTTLLLTQTISETILTTLKSISSEIVSECSLLHNPFDPQGHLLPPPSTNSVKSGLESDSSKNDPLVESRWRSTQSIRFLVRKIPENAFEIMEARVAVVGNVDAGKSSLLGVLTKGRLDDGRGRARVNLFRFKHEIESGRTSSVGMELLGFLPSGEEVAAEGPHGSAETSLASLSRKQQLSWENISTSAAKVICFTDLCGHQKYLKTTLFGLTATSPDYVLLIIGANNGLIGMSKEHLSVALALSIPVVCVITKIDMTPPNVTEQTLKQLVKILKSPGCRKTPVFVKDIGMSCELASSFLEEKACPIFLVSNVTGEGLPLLRTFLNAVPTNAGTRYPTDADLEFSISDVFSVPFVGTVISGVILSGAVTVGDTVLLGPDSLGAFTTTVIKSIQRKRVNVTEAEAGQSVSFGLKKIKRAGVRKGMVLLAKIEGGTPPKAVLKFQGQVLILYHNTLIAPRYQAMLHLGSVRQTVQIESIEERSCIRTGDRATCTFRFLKFPEYIKVGDRFLFREGKTKALGVVSSI